MADDEIDPYGPNSFAEILRRNPRGYGPTGPALPGSDFGPPPVDAPFVHVTGEVSNYHAPESATAPLERDLAAQAVGSTFGLGQMAGDVAAPLYYDRDYGESAKNAAILAASVLGPGKGRDPLLYPTKPGVAGRAAIQSGREALIAGNEAEALRMAQAGTHLKRTDAGGKTGKYSGAPDWVDTPGKLNKMRDDYDTKVASEAGVEGADWYDRMRGDTRTMTGDNPAANNQASREFGITSAQATPDTNLGFMLRGHQLAALGKPSSRVRTDTVANSINKSILGEGWADQGGTTVPGSMVADVPASSRMVTSRDNGGPFLEDPQNPPIPLGRKTGMYADRGNPEMPAHGPGANDIWHARNYGYVDAEGNPWDSALTPQQHTFMDNETLLAAARASANKIGGRDNWTAGEVQASPWVKAKTDANEAAGMDPETAKREANKTYSDHWPKYTMYGNHEFMPGSNTGHLEGIQGNPAAKAALDYDPRSSWKDASSRDAIYSAMGQGRPEASLYGLPTLEAQGIFEGELNRGQSARALTPLEDVGAGSKPTYAPHPAMLEAARAAEHMRGLYDAQKGSAVNYIGQAGTVGEANALHSPFSRALTPEEAQAAEKAAGAHGMGLIDTGEGLILRDFAVDKSDPQITQSWKALSPEISGITGNALTRSRHTSEYIDRGDTLAKANEGKGLATREMLKDVYKLDPKVRQSLDQNQAVRDAIAARYQRDKELAAKYGFPLREDVQNLRMLGSSMGPISGPEYGQAHGWKLPAIAAGALTPFAFDRDEQ